MKAFLRILPSLLLAALLVGGLTSCIMEEKVIELVLTGQTAVEFAYNDTDEVYTESLELDFTDDLLSILDDAGVSRDEIKSAHVVGVEYGATALDSDHDWTVTGTISVDRDGTGFQALTSYTSQSLEAALGQKLSAPLQEAGVIVINAALEDFIAGENPVLTFRLTGGDVVPDPSVADPIIFTWKAWLTIQLSADQTLDVPDPF